VRIPAIATRRARLALGLLLVVAGWGRGARGADEPGAAASRLLATVRSLTAPELAGRGAGTLAAGAVADSVAAWLEDAGLEPAFGGSWFQAVPLAGEGLDDRTDRNVAGIRRGRGALGERWLVVGAHHDHLGRVDPAATGTPAPGEYYPGGNDNASGVAVLRELARLSAVAEGPDVRSCLFVAFAAEEAGLQGSNRFVAAPPVDLALCDAMINLDCVGRLEEDRLYVGGVGTAAPLANLLTAANDQGLRLELERSGWAASDHVPFNAREIPVLFLFSGPYPQYNRPSDDWTAVVPADLARVTAFGAAVISRLQRLPEELAYVAVGSLPAAAPDAGARPRRAWLGTIPDFGATDAPGVTLAGVIDGSPAARAGLAKGDVLVMMRGREVADLSGLTEILRECEPGDQVSLAILRDGRRLEYILVLADRSERP
jgi:aminopeptidase YwaD